MQSKYIKMYRQKIPSIGGDVFEFFCLPLCRDYLYDLHNKFQLISTYDKKIQFQICSLCYNLFLSYAVKRHTERD